MKKWFILIIILLFLIILPAACSNSQNEEHLTISAAASLSEGLEVIGDLYKAENPEISISFNFGASGSLRQQITQGAPVDLFFSAATDEFDLLIKEGKISEKETISFLSNSIVLIASPESENNLVGIQDITKEEINKISLGLPETVPAGKYGIEVLKNLEIWEEVESKIVYAKDVRQALSYVETNNVTAALVYETDAALSENVVIIQKADHRMHSEIIYPAGVINDSEKYDMAMDFLRFLQSDAALEVFEDYGFIIK